jgi:helix-turn-helix protein
MPTKRIDMEKAIERERCEPKLKTLQPGQPSEDKIRRKSPANNLSFEIRLKKNSQVEKDKFIQEDIRPYAENIEIGMTPDEIIKAVGKPQLEFEWYTGNKKYNYGDVWIVIENGKVTCLVLDKYFEKYWGKSDYQTKKPAALVK